MILAILLLALATQLIDGADFCQQNWHYYNGNCYLAVNDELVFPNEARSRCLAKKADLASIGSEAEDFFLRGLIAKLDTGKEGPVRRYTIGLKLNRDAQGAIEKADWYDNAPITFGNPLAQAAGTYPWGNGAATGGIAEPKEQNKQANCVSMLRSHRTNGDWSANQCQGIQSGYICKYTHDGQNDNAISDKEALATKCTNGYIKFGTNCYKAFNSEIATAATAELACQADGGHLAAINSEPEDTFIKGLINHLRPSYLANNQLYRYFIGLHLERGADGAISTTQWRNGDPVEFGNPVARGFLPATGPWANGQPWGGGLEPKQKQDASIVYVVKNALTSGAWVAGSPTLTGGYICEIKGAAEKKKLLRHRRWTDLNKPGGKQ